MIYSIGDDLYLMAFPTPSHVVHMLGVKSWRDMSQSLSVNQKQVCVVRDIRSHDSCNSKALTLLPSYIKVTYCQLHMYRDSSKIINHQGPHSLPTLLQDNNHLIVKSNPSPNSINVVDHVHDPRSPVRNGLQS